MLCLDEARFGLFSWHKRRYRHYGERPDWTLQRRYEWLWLFAAVEPSSGKSVSLYLPSLDRSCFEVFLQEVSHSYPNHQLLLVLDNSPAHLAKGITIPNNITLLPLPPYSPELNPIERWFLEFRRVLANTLFDSLDELQTALTSVLKRYWDDPDALKHLTNFPWWRDAIEQL